MTVEILSCNTGKGANPLEQQLANELNTTVKAPNEYLWFSSHGKINTDENEGCSLARYKQTSHHEKLYSSK